MDHEHRVAAVAALDQPLRRDLYDRLARSGHWTTRDEAAEDLGIARSVAAFHLDKLVEAGVLEVRFERMGGRTGPGAGRPSKLYRRVAGEVGASVPDRRYDLAGSLLATAVAESTATNTPVGDCLHEVAHAAGEAVGERAREGSVVEALSGCGYEPRKTDADIVLTNCPFHRLAEEQRDLVCGMNLDFVEGVIEGLASDDVLTARLDPSPGQCCVRIASG
jgi:predicted ArsR family transcriptional regulator